MKILLVAGARPNFVKIAPILRGIEALNRHSRAPEIIPYLVHTGQHYDREMSDNFFRDLGIRKPDITLTAGSGSHGEQTARALTGTEKVIKREKPAVVLVVGDVNSTLAAALAAAKLGVPVAHVEAGLRSFDRSMPEEINRVLTDALADCLFVPAAEGVENLRREGIEENRIFLVGDIMVDALLHFRQKASASGILEKIGLEPRGYALLTLHRPGNVDHREKLESLLSAAGEIAGKTPVVFPVHPRTAKNIDDFGLAGLLERPGMVTTPPLGYFDCLKLEMEAAFVMTDSGGIQAEAYALRVPCLTLRETTERRYTLVPGGNTLVGADRDRIMDAAARALEEPRRPTGSEKLDDGRAAERILEVLVKASKNFHDHD